MTADSAIRTLRAAAAAHESLEADDMVAIVEKMNALKPGSAERQKLHRQLTKYADSRGRRPSGNVQLLDTPRTSKVKASSADSGRLAALQTQARKTLGEWEPLSASERKQLRRRAALVALEAEERGIL